MPLDDKIDKKQSISIAMNRHTLERIEDISKHYDGLSRSRIVERAIDAFFKNLKNVEKVVVYNEKMGK